MALANRFTNSQVEALKYGIPDHAGNDREWRNDGNGLYIRVRPNGAKSWLKRWCEREGISPRFRPHDLRRTFVTEMNELGVEPYVIEKLFNHSMNGVMAVYNKAEYADERIEAASLWGKHVIKIISAPRSCDG